MKIAETVDKLKKETKVLRKEVIIIKSLLKQQSLILQTLLEKTYVNKSKFPSKTRYTKTKFFPITTQEELDHFEKSVNETNRQDIIEEARLCIRPYGLGSSLKSILSHKLASDYNLDGTYSKKRLFNYENLLDVIYRAVECDYETHDQFIKHMRLALHNLKKKNARSRWSLAQLKNEVQKMDDDNESETEDEEHENADADENVEYLEDEIQNL